MLASVYSSRTFTPATLAPVRREFAQLLGMDLGEPARSLLLRAYRTEVLSRVTWARPVPAPRVDPAFRLAQHRVTLAARKADAARLDPRFSDADVRRLEDRVRELQDRVGEWCQCGDMCECDHP